MACYVMHHPNSVSRPILCARAREINETCKIINSKIYYSWRIYMHARGYKSFTLHGQAAVGYIAEIRDYDKTLNIISREPLDTARHA